MPLSQSSSVATTIAAQTGLALAATAINEAGGVKNTPIQLWWADTGNLPDTGMRAAEDAILRHCAVALIGSNNSETAVAIDAIAQRYGVPHIAIDAAANELTASLSPTIFRLAPSSAMIAAMHADWLGAVGDYNDDGVKSVAIIAENRPWPLTMAESIAQSLNDEEFTVDTYPVDMPTSDFSSLIARIVVKDTLPDAILIRVNRDASATLVRQLLENGVGPTRKSLLVPMRLYTNEDIPALGGEENLAWLVTPRVGVWSTQAGVQAEPLVDGFTRLFGRWPESAAFLGFDSLYLLADAMERSPTLAPDELVAALESADIELAGGRYHFPYGSANPPAGDVPLWTWHQWIDQPQLFLQFDGAQPPTLGVIWPPESSTVAGPVMRAGG
jgi:branched-chain amino acid transport system substrate-binding protein